MAVETAADRASFIIDFGASVTWRATTFLAIFDRPTSMVAGLSEVELVNREPSIALVATDLPSGATEDDAITVTDDFGNYSFRCKTIRPDGTGYVNVDLKV